MWLQAMTTGNGDTGWTTDMLEGFTGTATWAVVAAAVLANPPYPTAYLQQTLQQTVPAGYAAGLPDSGGQP
jgi:hypothetical protein